MPRVILLILLAAAALAQTPPSIPEKSPQPDSPQVSPEVDAALRARVSQFYQLEVAGKFNQALQMVAEDTKDLFVGSSKPIYQSYEIQAIRYSEDLATARVVVLVTRMVPLEGFMGHPLPTRVPSRWKLENGQWCFYVDPKQDFPVSPFGTSMAPPTGGPPATPHALPTMPGNLPDPRLLTVDKPSVRLKTSGPSSEQVVISNSSPWVEKLTLFDPRVAGLSVKLDALVVRPGRKIILTIASNGNVQVPKMPVTIIVKVQQTNQTIPVKVAFGE
jgi:hypothetical protein